MPQRMAHALRLAAPPAAPLSLPAAALACACALLLLVSSSILRRSSISARRRSWGQDRVGGRAGRGGAEELIESLSA